MRDYLKVVNGYEVKTEGDAFMVSFWEVKDAVDWCVTVQLLLLNEANWPEAILESPVGAEERGPDGQLLYRFFYFLFLFFSFSFLFFLFFSFFSFFSSPEWVVSFSFLNYFLSNVDESSLSDLVGLLSSSLVLFCLSSSLALFIKYSTLL